MPRERTGEAVSDCVDCDCIYIETGKRESCPKHLRNNADAIRLQALEEARAACMDVAAECDVDDPQAAGADACTGRIYRTLIAPLLKTIYGSSPSSSTGEK